VGALLAAMDFFHRQFDQQKPAQSHGQALLMFYLQIIMVAVGAFSIGLTIPLLISHKMSGDWYGLVPWEITSVTVSLFLVLISVFGIRRLVRRLMAAQAPRS
jgi:hypothetical protein